MQRPVSATIFGILNIAFAVLGVFGIIASIALFSMAESSAHPVVKIMRANPAYASWLKITIPLGAAACGVLLAAGIGLLMMKNWGRKLSLGYAIYAIVFGLVGIVINYLFLLRPMLEQASRKSGPEAAGAIGGAVGGSVGGCVGLVYPILLLIFMTRPKLVNAFRGPAIPPVPPPM